MWHEGYYLEPSTRSDTGSGYMFVSYVARVDKYQVRKTIEGVQCHLGLYDTAIKAALAAAKHKANAPDAPLPTPEAGKQPRAGRNTKRGRCVVAVRHSLALHNMWHVCMY